MTYFAFHAAPKPVKFLLFLRCACHYASHYFTYFDLRIILFPVPLEQSLGTTWSSNHLVLRHLAINDHGARVCATFSGFFFKIGGVTIFLWRYLVWLLHKSICLCDMSSLVGCGHKRIHCQRCCFTFAISFIETKWALVTNLVKKKLLVPSVVESKTAQPLMLLGFCDTRSSCIWSWHC